MKKIEDLAIVLLLITGGVVLLTNHMSGQGAQDMIDGGIDLDQLQGVVMLLLSLAFVNDIMIPWLQNLVKNPSGWYRVFVMIVFCATTIGLIFGAQAMGFIDLTDAADNNDTRIIGMVAAGATAAVVLLVKYIMLRKKWGKDEDE